MTAISIDSKDLTRALSIIRGLRRDNAALGFYTEAKRLVLLEELLTPRAPETMVSEVPEFNTVLGYLTEYDPIILDLMNDPIRDTQRDGFWLTHRAKQRGLPVIKVPAPKAVTTRYPEVTQLNAYPVGLLRERFKH